MFLVYFALLRAGLTWSLARWGTRWRIRDTGDVAVPPEREILPPGTLAEASEKMKKLKAAEVQPQSGDSPAEAAKPVGSNNGHGTLAEQRPLSKSKRTRKAVEIEALEESELPFEV